MFSYLIQDVTPLRADVVLMARLRDGMPLRAALRRPCRLGIAGPGGRVYRVIVCDAPVEKARMFVALRELGFTATPSQVGMTVFAAQEEALNVPQAMPAPVPG